MRVRFKLTIDWEGEALFEEKEELILPDYANDETLGFSVRSFAEIIFKLLVLATCKGVGYGPSWKKKGEVRGVSANIDRKYDRLSQSFDDMAERGRNDPGPRFDGAGDLAVYCVLYISSLLRQKYPEAYKEWMGREVDGFIGKFRPSLLTGGDGDDKKATATTAP